MTNEQIIENCEGILRVMHGNIRRRFFALHETDKSINKRQAIKIDEYEIAITQLVEMLNKLKHQSTSVA